MHWGGAILKLVKLKVGDNKIKSENIEIAILFFNLLHQARGSRKYRRTDRQTHRQTDTQTESFFIVVVTRGSVAASRRVAGQCLMFEEQINKMKRIKFINVRPHGKRHSSFSRFQHALVQKHFQDVLSLKERHIADHD